MLGGGPEAFLTALQLADSFFPTGMYAHSHGLEGMVRRGMVSDAAGVEEFLRNQLAWSVLPCDGVALLNAYRAASASDLETVAEIDLVLFASKLARELRSASVQVGKRLLAETSAFLSSPFHAAYCDKVARQELPGNAAVALAMVAHASAIEPRVALLMFCHSHAVSVLGAAMRLLPVTHSQVQGILRRLQPMIAEQLDGVAHRSWEDMTTFMPELELVSMGHEVDDLRMFAS